MAWGSTRTRWRSSNRGSVCSACAGYRNFLRQLGWLSAPTVDVFGAGADLPSGLDLRARSAQARSDGVPPHWFRSPVNPTARSTFWTRATRVPTSHRSTTAAPANPRRPCTREATTSRPGCGCASTSRARETPNDRADHANIGARDGPPCRSLPRPGPPCRSLPRRARGRRGAVSGNAGGPGRNRTATAEGEGFTDPWAHHLPNRPTKWWR